MPDPALRLAIARAEFALCLAECHVALAHAAVLIAEGEALFAELDRSREEREERRRPVMAIVVGADGVTREM